MVAMIEAPTRETDMRLSTEEAAHKIGMETNGRPLKVQTLWTYASKPERAPAGFPTPIRIGRVYEYDLTDCVRYITETNEETVRRAAERSRRRGADTAD
jgi:hypothetical protein